MSAPPRRVACIIAPPEICTLCKEPLPEPSEISSWNGNPAHRDCVRIHLIQRDPAFREGDFEEAPVEGADSIDGVIPREDAEPDPSCPARERHVRPRTGRHKNVGGRPTAP